MITSMHIQGRLQRITALATAHRNALCEQRLLQAIMKDASTYEKLQFLVYEHSETFGTSIYFCRAAFKLYNILKIKIFNAFIKLFSTRSTRLKRGTIIIIFDKVYTGHVCYSNSKQRLHQPL